MRKLAFAPLSDKIVRELRAKTGVFALGAQYTIIHLLFNLPVFDCDAQFMTAQLCSSRA